MHIIFPFFTFFFLAFINKCMFYFILHYFISILFLYLCLVIFFLSKTLFYSFILFFLSILYFPPSCTNNSFIFFQLYCLFNISILIITITILINSILHSPNIIIIIIIKNKTSYFNDPYNISLQSIK